MKQVVLCGIVGTEGLGCSRTNLVESILVDGTVLAEIKHFRQTCERTGFHTCSAFGAIRAMSVPDGFSARPKPKMITRTRIQHLALSFWTPRATERPRQLQQNFVVSTFEAEREAWDVPVGGVVAVAAFLRAPIRVGK